MSILNEISEKFPRVSYTKEQLDSAMIDIVTRSPFDSVIITGTTPSFNDGDPCRHSENIEIDNRDEWNREPVPAEEEFIDALEYLRFVREEVYDTNWRITLQRTDGVVSLDMEDYYADY